MLSHVLADGEMPLVSVEIPELDLPVSAGEFTAPIHISEGQGLRGAEIRLSYDTTLLDADRDSVQAGSIWPGKDTVVMANVDDASGTIVAWVFRTEGLDAGDGSLLDVVFRTTESAGPNVPVALDLTSVRLNEGQIQVNPIPRPGVDETDGPVRFSGLPSVAGPQTSRPGANPQPQRLDSFIASPAATPSPAAPSRTGVEVRAICRPMPAVSENSDRLSGAAANGILAVRPAKPETIVVSSAAPVPNEPRTADLPRHSALPAQQVVLPIAASVASNPLVGRQQILGFRRLIGTSPAQTRDPLLPTHALDYVLQQTGSWLYGPVPQ